MPRLRFFACTDCEIVFAVPAGTTARHGCAVECLEEITANPQGRAYFAGERPREP
jgi:hypothetical protein